MNASDTPNRCQASCEAPTGDGQHLCRTHSDELAAALRAAPALADDLDITITRRNRTSGQQHGSRSTNRPLPWNEHASACKVELTAIICAWAYETSQIDEDDRDPLAPIHSSDTHELARWLGRNLPALRRHEQAGDAHAEILDAITQATRAIDLPPERKFIGTCGQHPDDWPRKCKQDLYAMPNQRWVVCRNCTHRHDADERRQEMLDRIEDQLVHAGLLSSLVTDFGVPVVSATIRSWAHRGRLPVKGNDKNRRPLYRVGDVLDLALRRADAA